MTGNVVVHTVNLEIKEDKAIALCTRVSENNVVSKNV